MSNNVVLSAGVRQNLLSLQSTANLMSITQNRLATGKKVNSALDNPGNFFTSQSLNNRASDLNALLDSIGQAQKTLEAADGGITSLTKLVESAKSIAKQAIQAPQPSAVNYSAVALTSDPSNEVLGTSTGTISVVNSTTYQFEINVAGGGVQTIAYTSSASATADEIANGLNAALVAAGVPATSVTASTNGAGTGITLSAVNADSDFVISNASSNTGLSNGAVNSTSLLDSIGTAGQSITVAVNGGANQVINFGTGVGEVSTLAELQTKLNTIAGITATASNGAINLSLNTSTTQNSITITSSNALVTTALGIGSIAGNTYQGTASVSQPNSTRTSLQNDFNNVLQQIDALAGDASYNGVNLLAGDTLKVVFNEDGSSFLNIAGVTFDSTGLGLTAVAGAGFQSDAQINTTLTQVDNALKTLRTQASAFGSNLTTVQTRQDFTKNLINTLQTGADNLVLADTNEEGANMLALQTRQQLSTTALSLSAQADQAVLKLFG
jgi:flagellin